MEVIFLTTLFSVLFAALFLLLFFRARQTNESCAEQDALLPFDEGTPVNSLSPESREGPNETDPNHS
ncbi:MAG: hypothetical protein AAGC68_08605 [Verrucomicrobiota bacterium]